MIPIEITLDKPRLIKLTFLSMRKAERERGMGWMAMLSPQNAGADTLLCLLWAGLLKDDPSLTINQLDRIIEDTWEKDHEIGQKIDLAISEALQTQGWYSNNSAKVAQVADTKNPD